MPLINGMKMACEPCIRGHRSTKCNHANERLMVPVRKPGRPLSACPHPRDQPCGCGSVTAAIPRKQACHCGGDSPAPTPSTPQSSKSAITELPSPTKVAFKVQKSSSTPTSSGKQSIGAANLERMDMNNVNILSIDQRLQGNPMLISNGLNMPNHPSMYGYQSQYMAMPQTSQHAMQIPPQSHNMVMPNGNGISSEHRDLERVDENHVITPTYIPNGTTNGGSCCAKVSSGGEINGSPKSSSCCGSKQNDHSRNSSGGSSIAESQEGKIMSCCSSKKALQAKQEPMSNVGTALMSHMPQPSAIQPMLPFNHDFMPPYPHPTLFTYPPTYGSYQNPLQPSEWRNSIRAMTYNQPQAQMPLPPNAYGAPVLPETMDTVHSCSCGEECQCLGCAAHPYNDATQDYVRSAWSSMMAEQSSPIDKYRNDHPIGGHEEVPNPPPRGTEELPPPTAHTPSSTTSGNAEEQSLSATDFFFVNYPFTSKGCGGATQSCPCGDDCECLGCTIHRGPELEMPPCAGAEDFCPCGDDCLCIGCSIHKTITSA